MLAGWPPHIAGKWIERPFYMCFLPYTLSQLLWQPVQRPPANACIHCRTAGGLFWAFCGLLWYRNSDSSVYGRSSHSQICEHLYWFAAMDHRLSRNFAARWPSCPCIWDRHIGRVGPRWMRLGLRRLNCTPVQQLVGPAVICRCVCIKIGWFECLTFMVFFDMILQVYGSVYQKIKQKKSIK